jgi:hypothetical protein
VIFHLHFFNVVDFRGQLVPELVDIILGVGQVLLHCFVQTLKAVAGIDPESLEELQVLRVDVQQLRVGPDLLGLACEFFIVGLHRLIEFFEKHIMLGI